MTADLAPLSLPTSDWEGWLADAVRRPARRGPSARRRCSRRRRRPRAGAGRRSRSGTTSTSPCATRFAVASAAGQRAPGRGGAHAAAEQAEQDASRLRDRDRARPRRSTTCSPTVDPERARRGGPAGARARAARLPPRRRRPGRGRSASRLRELAERETAVGQEFAKNIRDGVRSVRVRPGRPRRAAGRLRRGPPAGRRTGWSRSPPTTPTTSRS